MLKAVLINYRYCDTDCSMIYDAWLVPAVVGSSVYNNCRCINILKEFGFRSEANTGDGAKPPRILIQTRAKGINLTPRSKTRLHAWILINASKSWIPINSYPECTKTHMHLLFHLKKFPGLYSGRMVGETTSLCSLHPHLFALRPSAMSLRITAFPGSQSQEVIWTLFFKTLLRQCATGSM